MSNITTALIIVLSISVMLVLGGIVASDIAGEDKTIMSCQGSLLQTFGANNCTGTYVLDTSNPTERLPSSNINPVNPTGVSEETGIFASIGSWLADVTGISYLYNIVSAPSTFLKSVGLPSVYADLISTIWYGVVLFLVVSWLKGQSE